MVRTALLDDDILSSNAGKAALSAFDDVTVLGAFSKSAQLFEFLKLNSIDLLFLDIELDGETGFSIAKRLKADYPDILLVFLTGHSSYAIDGYDFHPVGFLTKPINPIKLRDTLDEVRLRLSSTHTVKRDAKLMLRMSSGHQVIDVQQVCCFERRNRKIYMITEDSEHPVGNYTMSELEELLVPYGFFCCHQSFLISLFRVTGVVDTRRQLYEAELRGYGKRVPVSRHRYRELIQKLRETGINQ